MDKLRLKRVESLLREELALLILKEVKDPRIDTLLSITEVKVSRDLSLAKVYISHYSDSAKCLKLVEVLNHAAPFFQQELAKRIRLRRMPHLFFLHDISIERGFRITETLKKILPHD